MAKAEPWARLADTGQLLANVLQTFGESCLSIVWISQNTSNEVSGIVRNTRLLIQSIVQLHRFRVYTRTSKISHTLCGQPLVAFMFMMSVISHCNGLFTERFTKCHLKCFTTQSTRWSCYSHKSIASSCPKASIVAPTTAMTVSRTFIDCIIRSESLQTLISFWD